MDSRYTSELRIGSRRDRDSTKNGSALARMPHAQGSPVDYIARGTYPRVRGQQVVLNATYANTMEGLLRGVVHIVDGDASFRTTIQRRLELAGYEVETYASAHQLLKQVPDECVSCCILLELRIPGMDGPALQSRLNELGSTVPIIFVAANPDIPTTVRAIKAGAEDFLIKPVSAEILLAAVEKALLRHQGSRMLKSRREKDEACVAALTPRERQVFGLVVCGQLNKQIAYELGCTLRTIKAHRHRVMEKLQARSLAELVSLAERVGFLSSAAGREPQDIKFNSVTLVARTAVRSDAHRTTRENKQLLDARL